MKDDPGIEATLPIVVRRVLVVGGQPIFRHGLVDLTERETRSSVGAEADASPAALLGIGGRPPLVVGTELASKATRWVGRVAE